MNELGADAHGYAINDIDEVVGWAEYAPPESQAPRGALWGRNRIIDLGTLGNHHSWAEDINNHRRIVGWSFNADGNERAFLWEKGSIRELDNLGGNGSWAYGVNDRGQIVGSSENTEGRRRGLLIDTDGSIYDINDLAPPRLDVIFHGARSINELGQIVASAELPDGTRHAYLLSPDTLLRMDPPIPGTAGTINSIEITNATPGHRLYIAYGTTSRSTNVPFCNSNVSIQNPTMLGKSVADGNGITKIEFFVLKQAAGITLFLQALDIDGCHPSNLTRVTFE